MSESPAYEFKPHERPTLPGSPANPDHPSARRVGYFAIGILLGITGGLGNALVTVNLAFAQGTLGLYSNETAWLTAAYFMTNVTANLLLVKYRQQFGLQPFVRYTLAIYALATLMHLFVHDFTTAVAVRAVSGIAATGLSTMTILYLMQSMPPPARLIGVMIGICVSQLATPLARLFSPRLLDWGDWHMVYWFELALALASLAAVMALPLPPSERHKAFRRLDFVTFGLLGPGLALLVAVLSQGQILWWAEREWLGWALVASIGLIATALIIEHYRAEPLLHTRWISTREILRLMGIAVFIRILLSEQTSATALMTNAGMLNDQMIMLNLIILIASIAGVVTAVFTFRPDNLGRPITIAAILIAIGAFMDAGATNVTRPENLYISQALIGFASFLFLAQAMVIGIARTLLAGGQHFISFVVMFSLSQSVGALIGNALFGSFQILREKFHSHELVQSIVLTDPQVAARVRASGGALARVIGDPVLNGAQGMATLAQQVTREANVLAYNDVFLLVGVMAVGAVIWSIVTRWAIRRRGEISPVILLQQKMMAAAQGGQ